MIDYGKIRSTVKPEAMEIDEYSVYVNTDIHAVESGQYNDNDGETATITEYEYKQKRYTKNEYIKLQAEQIAAQDAQLTDTQLAICEIYEGMI